MNDIAIDAPRRTRGATACLAGWLAGTRFDALSPEVVEHVKWCFVDTIACGLGGSRTHEAKALVALARATGAGASGYTIFGAGARFGLLQAAQANRVLINVLDFDDTVIGTGHMSSVAVAAALAMGEHLGSNGRDLITALALAYEMPLRLRQAVNPTLAAFRSTFERVDSGVHFCATVAAGRLLGLGASAFQDALGLTGHLKPWHVTAPPMSEHGMPQWFKVTQGDVVVPGLQAALLAADGFPGDRGIFDQQRNYAALVGSDRYDAAPLIRPFEPPYQLLGIGFKAQPCCRHISAFADAVSRFRERTGCKPDQVQRIRARTHLWTTENLPHADPRHMIGAQFSMPHGLAMAMLGVPPGPEWYSDEALFGPAAGALRHRVELQHDERAQHFYDVERRYAGEVEIETTDGIVHREFVPAPKGAADNAFDESDHRAKFFDLAGVAGLANDRATRLWDRMRALESLEDLRQLTSLLAPA
ncbi:MAG: hypothetical protein LKCHEGNO_01689 [Burkholderiaceae bacterium]|nr:hypothetical protein [Burkholderiaceae bacterium]